MICFNACVCMYDLEAARDVILEERNDSLSGKIVEDALCVILVF